MSKKDEDKDWMKRPVVSTEEATWRMTKARTNMLMKHPFFGMLALQLRMVEVAAGIEFKNKRTGETARVYAIPTMAVDGIHMFYNPEFVKRLSDPEIIAVQMHEVLHCAFLHMTRRRGREPRLWNMACDYAINLICKDAGAQLPDIGICLDDKYRNMHAEDIYEELLKQQQQQGGGKGKGKGGPGDPSFGEGGMGEVLDAPDENEQTEGDGDEWEATPLDQTEMNWKQNVTQAATVAKMRGVLPAGFDRFVEELLEPKVDWRAFLMKFMENCNPSDYSWRRPDKRYLGQGYYLPSVVKDGMGEVIVAVDTSGSIGEEELKQFGGEIDAICKQLRPEKVYVVYCDAKVQHVQEFTPDDTITLEAKGGGGTSFKPPFNWAKKKNITPECLIYLTDMYGDFPDEKPEYDVLWVSISDVLTAPFGTTIKLDL